MTEQDDDIRRQARERLEARLEKRGAPASRASSEASHDDSSRGRVRVGRRMASEDDGLPSTGPSRAGEDPRKPGLAGWGFASKLTIALAVAALLVIAATFLAVSCSRQDAGGPSQSPGSPSSAASSTESAGSVASSASSSSSNEPAKDELEDLLGKEEAAKLISLSKIDDDALWIAAHPQAYAFNEQEKLLKLAAEDPKAVPYVRAFPQKYPQRKASDSSDLAMSDKSPSRSIPDTNIPHLYQWDGRWGYTEFNGSAFGLAGCGPTSLTMIYQGLTGKTDMTPYDMGQLAIDEGYVVEGAGTSGDLFPDTAASLGLACEEIDPTAEGIVETLKQGKPIIANVGIGVFSDFGHFFVLAGLTPGGRVILNDPYSAARSAQTWDPDLIAEESMVLFAYSKLEA